MCAICGTAAHVYVPGKPRSEREIGWGLSSTKSPWCAECDRGEGSHVHPAADDSGKEGE